MNLKYYLRGLGIGILVTALIMGISAGHRDRSMTDEEIRQAALRLGMVDGTNVLTEQKETDNASDGGTQEGETALAADAEENGNAGEQTADEADADESVKSGSAKADDSGSEQTGTGKSGDTESDRTGNTKADDTESKQTQDAAPDDTESKQTQDAALDGTESKQTGTEAADDTESKQTQDAAPDDTGGKQTGEQTEENTGEDTEANRSDAVVITVSSGDGSGSVARKLADAGLVESASSYDSFLCQYGYDKRLRVGSYTIPRGSNELQIARSLTGHHEN
ncbi:MAG: hypothetical protein IJ711_00605 [Lachnospiraceae bacterium]|nr:hypothetical protein [Lachnospiraceae bacterium]